MIIKKLEINLTKIIEIFKEIKKKIKFKNYNLPKDFLKLEEKECQNMDDLIIKNCGISLIPKMEIEKLLPDYKELYLKIYERLLEKHELDELDYNDIDTIVYEQAHEIDQKIKYVFLSSLISHYDFKNDKIALGTIFTSVISILNILEANILKNNPIVTRKLLPVGYHDEFLICSKILNNYIEHVIYNHKNINKI
jgi:hypothetical protein